MLKNGLFLWAIVILNFYFVSSNPLWAMPRAQWEHAIFKQISEGVEDELHFESLRNYILENKSSLSEVCQDGSPLHVALQQTRSSKYRNNVIELILDYNPDLYTFNFSSGESPLAIAIKLNDIESIKTLIKKGIKLDRPVLESVEGEQVSALAYAFSLDKCENKTIELLIKNEAPVHTSFDLKSILYRANYKLIKSNDPKIRTQRSIIVNYLAKLGAQYLPGEREELQALASGPIVDFSKLSIKTLIKLALVDERFASELERLVNKNDPKLSFKNENGAFTYCSTRTIYRHTL